MVGKKNTQSSLSWFILNEVPPLHTIRRDGLRADLPENDCQILWKKLLIAIITD